MSFEQLEMCTVVDRFVGEIKKVSECRYEIRIPGYKLAESTSISGRDRAVKIKLSK